MRQPLYTSSITYYILLGILFIIPFSEVYAQKEINVNYVTDNAFKIDGVLDEPMWEHAIPSSHFTEYFPTDTKETAYQTELRMLYNEEYLYIAITGYAPGKDYKTPSYERDFSISGADIINLMFDTYRDRTNAFLFGINPFGVLREGIIYGGGVDGDLDLNWNTKWLGESKIYDGYFISEVRIPMSAFKFKEGVTSWKFNVMRSDTQSNTKSSWSKVPQNLNQFNMGYFGNLIFERPLKQTKSPISVIPYVTPSFNKDYVNNEESFEFKAGFDAKVPVKNSFMLDLTVNPDFSSEDVVASQNNVTQFEIKQDETRQFFIDNGDLFNALGDTDNALPFYSRRIGVDTDSDGNTAIIDVNAGAKFTGKLNNKLRIGALDVQTGGYKSGYIPANNNLIVAAEQKVLKKSNLSLFFVNRQATNYNEVYDGVADTISRKTKYNRVVGSDFTYYSEDNSIDAKFFLHKSFTPGITSNAISAGTDINVEKRKYALGLKTQYVDKGFQSDLGYTKRTDILRANPSVDYNLYPEKGPFNTIIFNASNNSYWTASDHLSVREVYNAAGVEFNFNNGSLVSLTGNNTFIHLSTPFDPVGTSDDAVYLPVGDYTYNDLELEFKSDKRKALWAEGSTMYGSFYNGHKFTADVTFQYRYQPIFTLALQLQYDDINLPEPYSSDKLWYLGPTFNFTFSKKLFFNTDIQYSSQAESFLLVSRLQWRYAPLSDIFLTYNDVKTTSPFEPVQKGIYLKINYWFDINR
ncbi:carbohydrate binding family 9 domain-containing protein [Formosa sediminum]|uniref:Carbohydrate binding family 9 domain-containing protein n=1 Tax=Formosa sediminum TaxID=2594004 RepID=A0A516GNQ7_9FLAO|nr:DUF5916 domain-containing protein [Formosa sediminum]QDO93158.1 carbohydrate binding family 9 domain-containing protein [Formosa sediminum]